MTNFSIDAILIEIYLITIMTYSINIKKNGNLIIRRNAEYTWYRHPAVWLMVVSVAILVYLNLPFSLLVKPADRETATPLTYQHTNTNSFTEIDVIPPSNITANSSKVTQPEGKITEENFDMDNWETIHINQGENLSIIFDRLKLQPSALYQVMSASEDTSALKHLLPKQALRFLIEDGKLMSLEYAQDLTSVLKINWEDGKYTSDIIKTELTVHTREVSASIDSSLFLAGQKAGLSDNLIMQLIAVYGWDIDFALDIRRGDSFKVIYEERYKDDVKISDGPILAAEFVNRQKIYHAVRYTSPDGETDFYSKTGDSMRKAFLRTPLNFTRISSGFSLNRKHPILNTIRAHRGVDYAAPTGTPVKAAGDGRVTSIGNNGSYGKTIVLHHGGKYSTLYAHLSKYAKRLKRGSIIKQGQIIGYVGKTGLATGPHLHYEFRINGIHRNPLTVQFPKAASIPTKYRQDFKDRTASLLVKLQDDLQSKLTIIALTDDSSDKAAATGTH